MPGRDNSYEALARDAADRLDQARAQGQQLSLLGDAEPAAVTDGRAVRGKGKAMSQMREYLSSRGYRLPEEVLAQIAGLNSRDDVVLACMVDAERIVAWAHAGKATADGVAVMPSPAAMLRAFETVYAMRFRALDALMPYGLAKVTPDGVTQPVVNITMPAAPAQPADPALAARDVTPRVAGRMMPADMAWEIQQKQMVAGSGDGHSDAGIRTEGARD